MQKEHFKFYNNDTKAYSIKTAKLIITYVTLSDHSSTLFLILVTRNPGTDFILQFF